MLSSVQVMEGQTFDICGAENLTRSLVVQYAGASGDYNPLHTDEVYATEVAGYPSTFAHGMLTMGLTGAALTNTFGVGVLRRFGGRFRRPVWPGDSLAVKVVVTAISEGRSERTAELSIQTLNQRNELVFESTAAIALQPEHR
jgi:acyl dehydratase